WRGALICSVIDEPRGDLPEGTVAGERKALALEISGDQLFGLFERLSRELAGEGRHGAVAVSPIALGEPRQQLVEHRRPPEIMPKLEPPALGQFERIEQGVEQRDVAEAQPKVLEPGGAHRIGREQNSLYIGAVAVDCTEAFDAGLAELARVGLIAYLRLEAKGGTIIAIAGLGLGV